MAESLPEKWERARAHTYASENADHYRGFDAGRKACACELRERDAKIRAAVTDLQTMLGHWSKAECDALNRILAILDGE